MAEIGGNVDRKHCKNPRQAPKEGGKEWRGGDD
jgi:hypothetical protein